MTVEMKQRFEQVFLEAVKILRDDAPKDTGNLAYNAIKYKWENDSEFVIYVDMYKTQIRTATRMQKKKGFLKVLFVLVSKSMKTFGLGQFDRLFKMSFRELKKSYKALKKLLKPKKNNPVKKARGKRKKADGIAPYMPYTNEPWLASRWNGAQNPNEGWWNETIEFIVEYIGKRLGGEFV